ncbi:MAG: hypothetical protein ACREJM_14035 [Candidatus Saccharimonadales bacterium]
MLRSRWSITVGAMSGLVMGLAAYHLQNGHVATMNLFGVVAFVSLGASLGCLLAEPAR